MGLNAQVSRSTRGDSRVAKTVTEMPWPETLRQPARKKWSLALVRMGHPGILPRHGSSHKFGRRCLPNRPPEVKGPHLPLFVNFDVR
jgi:hypothetical protein